MVIYLRTNENLNLAGSCRSKEEERHEDLSKEEMAGLCNLLDTEMKDKGKSHVPPRLDA